jgi:hypothetical protein
LTANIVPSRQPRHSANNYANSKGTERNIGKLMNAICNHQIGNCAITLIEQKSVLANRQYILKDKKVLHHHKTLFIDSYWLIKSLTALNFGVSVKFQDMKITMP